MKAVKPAQHVLNQELRLSIRVGRKQAGILLNGNHFRLSIDGGGGGKDQAPRSVSQNRLKQREGGGGVIAEEDLWPHHGLARLNKGGKVENAIEGLAFAFGSDEKIFKRGAIG